MTDVISKPLPHGAVPFAEIRDLGTRKVTMELNENIVALKAQLEGVQRAVKELQRRR